MENMSDVNVFAIRLKQLRDEQGLSTRALATALGVSHGAISQYETGKRTPDIYVAKKFADFFNVTTDYLIGLEDTRTR